MSGHASRADTFTFWFERRNLKDKCVNSNVRSSTILNTAMKIQLKYCKDDARASFFLFSSKSFFAVLEFYCITDGTFSLKEMAPKFEMYVPENTWSRQLGEISMDIPVDKWGIIFIKLVVTNLSAKLLDCLKNDKLLEKGILRSERINEEKIVLKNISNLLLTQNFSDVELLSSDQKMFQAHRVILQCSSPVFAAMFGHNMVEKETNKVVIEDMNGITISEMLSYMYTGSCPNISTYASDLVFAADKYQLDGLKNLCELTLISQLTIKNAVQFLNLADKYNLERLKEHIYKFIKDKKGLRELIDTVGWKSLSKEMITNLIANCSS